MAFWRGEYFAVAFFRRDGKQAYVLVGFKQKEEKIEACTLSSALAGMICLGHLDSTSFML